MSITTKTGDKGMTSLYGGKRVWKDDLRIELCGNIDELTSKLGLIKGVMSSKEHREFIESLQKDMFICAAEFAASAACKVKLARRITAADVKRIEAVISKFEKDKNLPENFVITATDLSGAIDLVRTTIRDSETLSERPSRPIGKSSLSISTLSFI